jgi:hypothetical protein
VRLFYSYSHEDERLRQRLQKHLAPLKREGVLDDWQDRQIAAGAEWAAEIDQQLDAADIILLLISADFIASDFCWSKEMAHALERHTQGAARVIPVIVQPVDWSGAPFGKLQALPKDGKAVTLWGNKEAAWVDVAKGIRRVTAELTAARTSSSAPRLP